MEITLLNILGLSLISLVNVIYPKYTLLNISLFKYFTLIV